MYKILLIDDDLTTCTLIKKYLSKKGLFVDVVHTGMDGIQAINKSSYELIICDLRLPDMLGTEVLGNINQANNNILFIIITGYSDIKTAVQAIKSGAINYITKPINPEEFFNEIENALKYREFSDVSKAKRSEEIFLLTDSEISHNIIKQVNLVAPTELTILIFGETGCGKNLLANTIHKTSNRKNKPFVAVDCGALTKELAGSELFGHVKGSFTGALNDKKGLFEEAKGGTLFLDEIGNLTYENQVKLLRALQERKIRRIGAEKDIPVDVRIIAATNEDLYNNIKENKFRQDLYYRLNEFSISIPPLRERKEDLMVFANHFLSVANLRLNKKVSGFSEQVIEKFKQYTWNGNIRELRNVINRGVLLCKSQIFELDCLPIDSITYSSVDTIQDKVLINNSTNLKNINKELEKKAILDTLINNKFNKTISAKKLNINRTTLYLKMKEYNINLSGPS